MLLPETTALLIAILAAFFAFVGGYFSHKFLAGMKISSAEERARKLIEEANKEVESKKRELVVDRGVGLPDLDNYKVIKTGGFKLLGMYSKEHKALGHKVKSNILERLNEIFSLFNVQFSNEVVFPYAFDISLVDAEDLNDIFINVDMVLKDRDGKTLTYNSGESIINRFIIVGFSDDNDNIVLAKEKRFINIAEYFGERMALFVCRVDMLNKYYNKVNEKYDYNLIIVRNLSHRYQNANLHEIVLGEDDVGNSSVYLKGYYDFEVAGNTIKVWSAE